MKISYRHWVQFRGQALGLVWQTDDATQEVEGDTDGVLVDNGRVVVVHAPEDFSVVAGRYGLRLEKDNDEVQNLDGLERLLDLPASDDICTQVLNAWNLLDDIARSVGRTPDPRSPEVDTCYDKLFWGNNLESVTPDGEHYSPYFSDEERRLIADVLDRGRRVLAAHI
ncbi:hypothetical protein QO003_000896 [Arthrobacter silviterrae]|uniref:Uncharacterized protein n=1 Tax=Arthrobacter silviterrae TaxID=2026658 RepID=A0ABX0DHD9_9MICC|nr:hypothetical protein [Arthrobacter silviterrae]MDQ0276593.1 hypothetical protein [Arthrobacter silviterrae]NGN84789.1 hypothetical protein [Arthrobacter silviterrae]